MATQKLYLKDVDGWQ